jgi:hypothetical protein
MKENTIQLNNENIIKFDIQDTEGKKTGEYLEFDLDDINLLLRYQEMIELDKKNLQNLRNQLSIIDKQEDHKGKKLLSFKQEQEIKIMQNYYKKEVEILNMFLGENGVQKLLNGRSLGWTTLAEISRLIEEVILPPLQEESKKTNDRIKEKYSIKEDNVIE